MSLFKILFLLFLFVLVVGTKRVRAMFGKVKGNFEELQSELQKMGEQKNEDDEDPGGKPRA
jgi:Sec-independent protein translocase protein TatA